MHYLISIFLLFAYVNVLASPITANVIGSSVSKRGVLGGEYRNGVEWDGDSDAADGRYTDRIDVFYNMTDDAQFRVFLNRVNDGNDDADFTNVFIEPSFQLFDAATHGFDGLITTGLTLADGDNGAHQFRTILSGTIPYGDWYFRHNSVIAHQFGPQRSSGVRYEARWRVMKLVADDTHVGVEMFNDFGNLRTANGFDRMEHRAGPVMTGKFTDALGYQTGVLAGISDDAPDVAAKFWLNYRFDAGEW